MLNRITVVLLTVAIAALTVSGLLDRLVAYGLLS